ncbi:MAG: aminopeptidase, partial [Proteobacteria bacterium]|nr:aminopeptidase [Pseudomonadota bacterium]
AAKQEELARLRAEYEARRPELGGGFDWLLGPGLSPARLVPVATYRDCVPGLAARLAALGGELPAFYREARALSRRPAARRAACVTSPSSAPTPPPP